jgi:hypothetical protein
MKRVSALLSGLAVFCITSAPSTAAIDVEGSDCYAPHPSSSTIVKKCYETECREHLIIIAACEGDPVCIALENASYAVRVGLCITLTQSMETSEKLVVWQDSEGDWQISWPGEEIQSISERFEFNI